ncbi:MAG: hypothetical protein ACTSWL_00255 [Promethearchaeota archaeon]
MSFTKKKILNYSKIKKCPECQGLIIQNGYESVCKDCGLIITNLQLMPSYQISELKNSEFSAGDQYVSIGKTVDNVCALGSHIDYYSSQMFFDYKHTIINSQNQKKFKRLKHVYSLPTKIKNHETDYRVLKILTTITKYLNLSESVKNRAAYFYQIVKKKAKSIKNHISLIGFCIFYASREFSYNAPISIREICVVFKNLGHRISPKLIIRDSLEYKHILNIKNTPHQSLDFITRFIDSIVNYDEIMKRMIKKDSVWSIDRYQILLTKECHKILEKLEKIRIGSRNPFILAAGIVYCADKMIAKQYNTKSILTQKLASQAMKIPEYSIRDHYVKILKPIFFPIPQLMNDVINQ